MFNHQKFNLTHDSIVHKNAGSSAGFEIRRMAAHHVALRGGRPSSFELSKGGGSLSVPIYFFSLHSELSSRNASLLDLTPVARRFSF